MGPLTPYSQSGVAQQYVLPIEKQVLSIYIIEVVYFDALQSMRG